MSDTIRVKSFYSQEHARIAISEICARCVQDVLYMLDTATGPDGPDALDAPPDPETSKLYQEFRDWFGPNLGASIQGLVVGPLLSRISFDSDGFVHIEDDVYKHYESVGSNINARNRSRVKWLACELPVLIEQYRQLYESEEAEALALVQDIVCFDFESEGADEHIQQILPTMEMYNLYAQPGGRLIRGDADAEKEFASGLEWARSRLSELETETEAALSSESPTDDQKYIIEYEISKLSAKKKKLDKAVEDIESKIDTLVDRLYE
tara:strand:- start:2798 stop:3595 length:798 start_codon:yes stop_codon:yes gene_type:complete